MEEALSSELSSWQGRDEQIRKLQSAVKSLRKLLDNRDQLSASDGLITSSASGGKDTDRLLRDYSTKYQVAEVERDRLSEYVKVLTKRLSRTEETSTNAEAALREERRKTAKLERALEQAQIVIRDSDSGKSGGGKFGSSTTISGGVRAASSKQFFTRTADKRLDEKEDLKEEVEVLKQELATNRQQREEDLEMYLKMAADSRKIFDSRGVQLAPN